jgi:feruloyl esterase
MRLTLLAPSSPTATTQHDALTALEQWVEHGIAPDKIIATKYASDNPALGIATQRPLCPYPQSARWTGRGSTNDAANFVCVSDECSGDQK